MKILVGICKTCDAQTIVARPRNPVGLMDSVEALDLIVQSLKLLRDDKPADPGFLDRLREQKLRHRRALKRIIGTESI